MTSERRSLLSSLCQLIDRAKLSFILKRIGRPHDGQRARLERDFQEYLDELPTLHSLIRFANKRHRAVEMGRAGCVFTFGSNHMGQVSHSNRVRSVAFRACGLQVPT